MGMVFADYEANVTTVTLFEKLRKELVWDTDCGQSGQQWFHIDDVPHFKWCLKWNLTNN
jgi:hypothetical protein